MCLLPGYRSLVITAVFAAQAIVGLLAEVNELFASVSLERAHVLLVLSFASGL